MLDRCFDLIRRGATVAGEVRGGLTTFMVMAYTHSVTNRIGAGFVAYCFIKPVRGRASDVLPMMYLTASAFVVYFAAPLVERFLRA